jgi:thymidylate synthase
MNKRIFLSTLFLIGTGILSAAESGKKNVCEKNIQLTEKKIKKNFDQLWESVDTSVGVEFFMVVLKGNDRMPASELSSADYYGQLLKGMKKTSKELSDHGLSFDNKKVKQLEELIAQLNQRETCRNVVAAK